MAGIKTIIITATSDLSLDQRLQKTALSLHQAGYAVTLVGIQRKHSLPLPDAPYHQHRFRPLFKKGVLFYVWVNFYYWIYLLFRKERMVVSVDADTALAGLFATKMTGKKWVFDAHEWFSEVPELAGKKVKKALWKQVEKWAFTMSDWAYTVGEALAAQFEQQYHRKVDVIKNVPYYIESNTLPIWKEEGLPIIWYQGALNKGRGLELLIEVCASLPVKLILVGEGDLSEELRRLATEKGGDITFKGWLTPEELRKQTPKAWLGYCIMEEHISKSYYYSLSNKFFDYVMAGVPVLVNPFPEYKKMGEQYGIGIFISHQFSELRNAIEKVLSDQENYLKLRAQCRAAASKLHWNEEEKKLIAGYDQI